MAIDKTNKFSIVRGNTNEAEYIHSKLIEHNKKHITDYDKHTFSEIIIWMSNLTLPKLLKGCFHEK